MSVNSSYQLYYSPFACSFAVHAALEKIGASVDLTKIDIYKNEHLTPEFKKINPQAQVPVLAHKNISITQASAILLYLSEQHPEAELMPTINSSDRPKALQTLFYLSNTLHPLFLRLFYPERISVEASDEVKKIGIEKITGVLKDFDQSLARQLYTVSDTLYAPDYYLFAMLNWLRVHPIDISNMENIKAYIKRMKSHPEVQIVLGKEMQSMAA